MTGHAPPATFSVGQIRAVLAALMLGLFLAALDQTIVATALPSIVEDLGGVDQLVWVVVAYLLTTTATTPLWGKASDLYGRRPMLLSAVGVFLIGSALCAASQSMPQLVVARAIQGLGGGGLLSITFVVLGDILSPRQRGRYMGYFTAVFAVAGVAGPVAGGFLTDHLSWRWIFTINLPPGLLALAVIERQLRLPYQRIRRRLDWIGAVLLVAAVTNLVLVAVWAGDEHGWTSTPTVLMTVAGFALAFTFVAWERVAAEPILPLRLFRYPVVPASVGLAFFTAAVLYSGTVFLPLFLQGVRGTTASNSGLLLAPVMIGVGTSSMVAGRLTSHTGRYKPWVIIGAAGSIAVALWLSRLASTTASPEILASMTALGLSVGLLIPVTNLAAQNAVPFHDLATTTSTVSFARSLGSTLGVALFGAVLNTNLDPELDHIAATQALPPGLTASTLANGPEHIESLAEPLRTQVRVALADSIAQIYLVAALLAVLILVAALALREIPLRDSAPLLASEAQRTDQASHRDVRAPPDVDRDRAGPPPRRVLRRLARRGTGNLHLPTLPPVD